MASAPTRRGRVRALVWIVAATAALLVAPVLAVSTGPGRAGLVWMIEAWTAGPGFRLSIDRLDGNPLGRAVLSGISLADESGVWLNIETANVDWRPWRLWRGRVVLDRLAITAADVHRRPATEGGAGGTVPRVRVTELAVDRLRLGEAVAGLPATLQIAGSFAVGDNDSVESILRIVRLDGEERLEAAVEYRVAERWLRLTATASAPAGGVLPGLLPIPGAPATEASLRGEGPLEHWRATWEFAAGETVRVQGQARIVDLEALEVLIDGEATVAPLLPEWLRPFAAPQVSVSARARWDGVDFVVPDAILESAALRVRGNGEFSLADRTLAAAIALELLSPAPLAAVSALDVTAATARIVAEGAIAAPRFQATLDLDGVARTGGMRIAERIAARGTFEGNAFAIEADGEGIGLPPELRDIVGDRANASAAGTWSPAAISVVTATLEMAPGAVSASGRWELPSGIVDAAARLERFEVAAVNALLPVNLGGGLEAEMLLRRDAGGSLAVVASAIGRGLSYDSELAAAVLGPDPVAVLETTIQPDGRLSLGIARVESAHAWAEARGVLDTGGRNLDVQASAAVTDLRILAVAGSALSGAVFLDGDIRGPWGAAEADWRLRSPEFGWGGHVLRDLDAAGSARQAAMTLEIAQAAAHWRGRPVRAAASVVRLDRGWRLSGARADVGGDTLVADLAIPDGGGAVAGEARIVVNDLANWTAILPWPAGGAATANLTFGGDGGQQDFTVALAARDVTVGAVTARGVSATGRGDDVFDAFHFDAVVAVEDAEAGPFASPGIVAEARGSLDAFDFAVSARPAQNGGAGVNARGSFRPPDGAVGLSQLEAEIGGARVRLRSPTTLRFADDAVSFAATALDVGDGALTFSGGFSRDGVDLAARAESIPLQILAVAMPRAPLEGVVDVDLMVRGTHPRPQGAVTIATRGLRLAGGGPEMPTVSARATGSLQDGRLAFAVTTSAPTETPIEVRGELPVLTGGVGAPLQIADAEPFSADLAWRGELTPLALLLGADDWSLGGAAEVEIRVDGTVGAPRAQGAIRIRDGTFAHYGLGLNLDPITAEFAGDGESLRLLVLDASVAGGGTLAATGELGWGRGGPAFDLRFVVDDGAVVRRDDLGVVTDLSLRWSGDLQSSTLAGDVRTSSVEVRLAAGLPAPDRELVVRETGLATPPAPVQDEAAIPRFGAVALDVNLEVPNRLFVRGRGLDSEWRGTFHVGGTAESPQIVGKLDPVRGGFSFAGRLFTIEAGAVTFEPGNLGAARLDLSAVYRDAEFAARILVRGTAAAPEITLTSDPPLPQDEVLARVMFGRGIGRLSALEAVQLAQALRSLTEGEAGLLDTARDRLGLDVLSLAPGGPGAEPLRVEAGRYLRDDLYVGLRQGGAGAGPATSRAIIEWTVLPSVVLESEGGGAGESLLGIRWEWDY